MPQVVSVLLIPTLILIINTTNTILNTNTILKL